MNVTWMHQTLSQFVREVDAYHSADRFNEYDEMTQTFDAMLRLHYPVNSIIAALNAPPVSAGLPLMDLDEDGWETRVRVGAWSAIAHRAAGVVESMAEVAEHLAIPEPSLNAGAFHPWVWKAAASFWTAGKSAAAVETGAKSLTAFIQQKASSSLADKELVSDVFSPKPGRPHAARLWLPGDRDTDTWRSRQNGLHNLAMGAYAGIRNVVAHSVEPGWSDEEALEYLAVLSTVARWAEEADVVLDIT